MVRYDDLIRAYKSWILVEPGFYETPVLEVEDFADLRVIVVRE